jgi:4-hydroxy-3-methylbut-2-enyl diphosphate reductase
LENQGLEIPSEIELIFAEPRGFCFGVSRAISTVEMHLASSGRVYALGCPIHNPQEIERLCEMGLVIVEEPFEVPDGETVFIRAHGVSSKSVRALEAQGCTIIDGTCPFVRKAQERASQLSSEGYSVIILGDKDHPEVRAIREFAGGNVNVVDPSDLNVPEGLTGSKVGIVSQTTQRKDTLSLLVSSVTLNSDEVRVFNTICCATSARQDSVGLLAEMVDGIIVIGGRNSANTAKLVEISERSGTPTIWIEDDGELESGWFREKRSIGIAAGASTPDWLIQKLEIRLASAKSAREDGLEDD